MVHCLILIESISVVFKYLIITSDIIGYHKGESTYGDVLIVIQIKLRLALHDDAHISQIQTYILVP